MSLIHSCARRYGRRCLSNIAAQRLAAFGHPLALQQASATFSWNRGETLDRWQQEVQVR